MKVAVTITMFFTTFFLMYGLIYRITSKEKSVERLAKYMNSSEIDILEEEKKSKISVLRVIGEQLSKVKLITYFTKSTTNTLIQADIPLTGEELTVVQLVVAIPSSYLVLMMFKDILFAIITFIMFWIIPLYYIKFLRNRRIRKFNEQLGDALTIFSNSLKAGYSYLQAVGSIAKEMPDPISKEFARVLKEMSFGLDQSQSLNNMLDRVESEDLKLMITAVNIQRETGGNLSEILDNISSTIRDRVRLQGEVKTLTAQGRLSGIIVSLVPFALGFLMYLVNRTYFMTLFTEPIGRVMMAVALFNELVGIVLIKRIVKIEL